MDAKQLAATVALIRRDNAGRRTWEARFECSEATAADRLAAAVAESASQATARLVEGAVVVHIEFPPEFIVSISRMALLTGATYVRRGLGRLPQ
jgi:hypothetical protein